MKFKHKITGIVEDVTNKAVIPQFLKHSDIYEPVKAKRRNSAQDTENIKDDTENTVDDDTENIKDE